MRFGVKLQLPMEETATKILFTSDSTQHQKTLGDAMISVARRFNGDLLWLETAENVELTNALVDDLKKRANRDLTVVKKSGDFWSIAAKTSKEFKVEMTVIVAAAKSGSMLGGGMSSCISKFDIRVATKILPRFQARKVHFCQSACFCIVEQERQRNGALSQCLLNPSF